MSTTADAVATDWNLADIYEAVAARVPDRPCQIQGDRVVTWGEFDRRANALAADFLAAGLGQQAKVACYLYNCPEYMETVVAAFKVSAVPVNTNFRYGPEEILYLFDNADAEAVVFHASFTELLEGIRDRLPKVRRWYVVADEAGAGPEWATPYESRRRRRAPTASPPRGSAAATTCCCCTPAAPPACPRVSCGARTTWSTCSAPAATRCSARRRRRRSRSWPGGSAPDVPGHVMLVACPLMHGTGQFSAINALLGGGTVVSLPEPQVRRRRAVRRDPATAGDGDHHRRPGVRRPDARPPGGQPRRLRPVLDRPDHVVGRDVEPRQQGRADPPHPAGDPVRLLRLVGGRRPRRLGVGGRAGRGDRPVRARTELCGVHRRRSAGRAGQRRAGHGRRRRLHPARLLQGRGQVGADVPGDRGPAVEHPRRLRRGQRRRLAAPARSRLGVHQHRRREGLPGGGRGGAEDPSRPCRTSSPSACPTSASAR